MELKQLGSAVAFRDGNDHIMVKRDTSFGRTVKIPVGLERREIAFFVVHADERHKKLANFAVSQFCLSNFLRSIVSI